MSSFEDNFNVYELFLDYRDTSLDGVNEKFEWVFVPQSVYVDEALTEEILDKHFNFDDIYNRADHFFVNRDQLEELRERNELVLPIKTNLIMLDQTVINQAFPLLSLFFIIVFNAFRNERLVLYFQDGEYSITLERAFQLWYYIIFKRYGKDIVFTAPAFAIMFIIDNPISLDYTLGDIDIIQQEYDDLPYFDPKSGEKVRLFYKERIEDVFQQFQQTPINITQDEWTAIFKENLGKDLIEYVDGRLENIEVGSDISIEADKLLNEVYNSFITWSVISNGEGVAKYIHYFTDFLPFLMITPENTATFRVLNFMKPYHVELTGQGREIFRVKDKFNAVYADQEFNFIMEMSKATLNSISSRVLNVVNYTVPNSVHIVDSFYHVINQYIEMVVPIIDEFEPKIIDRRQTLVDQQYQDIKELTTPMWEYDLEGIVTVGQFVSVVPIEDTTNDILYDFPVNVSIPESSDVDIREDSKDTYTITPYMYNFNIGDRGDPKVLQYLETIKEIKYYLVFNLMFIKHSLMHSSHRAPQRIEQLKRFDALYTYIQGDTVSKLFKNEPSIVRQFKKYFKSNDYRSSFVEFSSDDFLPTTMIPPKFDNLLAHIEDDSISTNTAQDILTQEFMYSISPELPVNSLQEFSDRYFYNIESKDNKEFFNIDGYIDFKSRQDTEPELIDILTIYNFDSKDIKHSIAQIKDRYSTEFDLGPVYSNMHMLSWVKQTGMQEYLTLEAIEIYKFDSEIAKVTISNISDRMVAKTIMPPKFDNIHIFIDDYVIKFQPIINIDVEYSYLFDQNVSKVLLLDMTYMYGYTILQNPSFDNLHWFIYDHTGMRTEEFVEIDYSYKFSDDWSFLTDIDIDHIVSIPQDQPNMFDYLNIGVDNRTGLWGNIPVNLTYGYVFDQKILSAYVEEILEEFSFSIQLDSKYDSVHILSSFEGFSTTVSSEFNSTDYFENLIIANRGIIQHFQYNYSFDHNINKIEDFNILSKFKNIIGFNGELRNIYDYDWNFINSIVSKFSQIIKDEKCFNIVDKSRYDTFDTIHHYMPIPIQYGPSEFEVESEESQFTTIMPYMSNRYDYWEEAFQIIHQRSYHDGLPIQDNHILKHAYFERQIIEEFYRFLPMKYTEKTSTELSVWFSVPMWFRCKNDNFHIESNFYQIPVQNINLNINIIYKVPFNFNLIKGTDIEQSYLQWYEVDMSRLDNFHLHNQLHGFSFDVMDKSIIPSHNSNVIIDYQRGSTIDFWYFMRFNWNAIYSSIGLDLRHHDSFTQIGIIDSEINHYLPFDYTHLGDTNPRFLHHLDWKELHPVIFNIDEELVFTMHPQYVEVDIGLIWNVSTDFPEVYVPINDTFDIRMPYLLATWVYMISHIENLRVKQYGEIKPTPDHNPNIDQILPKMWVIEVKDEFPIEFMKENTEHLNIVSFGEPIPVQYGPAPLDVSYGFNFVDKFRRYMVLYEIESEYNFITKLFPQEDSMIVEIIGVPKNRHFEELFIEDYFLPINSEYFRSSIFNINDNIEFIVEQYRGYDNLNIISIGTAKNQHWDFSNIFYNFNFIESVFKNSLFETQHDREFSFFEKDKKILFTILDDSIFIFDYYLSDLFNGIIFNFDFTFIKRQYEEISISTKTSKYIESINNFDNLNMNSKKKLNSIQAQQEILDFLYSFNFEDFSFETKLEMSIGDELNLVISPQIIMNSQNYITDSDLSVKQLKEELMSIDYDYGQIGYAPEVIENIQEYDEEINMIISGNRENQENLNISHNFNTIKI